MMHRRHSRLADEFAAALDGRAPGAGGDAALRPMLALAGQLQSLPLGPTPDFRDSLRMRLLAVAAVAPAPLAVPSLSERAVTWVRGWQVQRGIAAAAAGMAAVVGIAGVSTAASRSVPGDAFYGTKRAAEGVQVAFARGDVGKGVKHLQHAETRLDEVRQIVGATDALGLLPTGIPRQGDVVLALGGSRAKRVIAALADMDEATRDGTRLLTEAYTDTRKTAPLRTLSQFVERQKVGLAEVVPQLPGSTKHAAANSLQLIADVEMRADALLNNGICGTSCAPVVPVPGATETPAPAPQPSPSSDDLGPLPCECEQPTGSPTGSPRPSPNPQPSGRPTSRPTSEPSPEPTTEPSSGPFSSILPSPIGQTVDDLLEEVQELLPTPIPLPPAPKASAPVPAPVPVAPAAAPAPAPAGGRTTSTTLPLVTPVEPGSAFAG